MAKRIKIEFPFELKGEKIKQKLGLEKVKIGNKTKMTLIGLLSFIILAFLLFNFKHFFIVAIVNNSPITRYALDRELEKQGGQQVLEGLINKSLILQEAQRQKVTIGQEKIDEKIKEIEAQLMIQGSNLDDVLKLQGQTREALEEEIKIQLILEEILGEDITISEEEARNYFEENKDFFEEEVTFEEVRSDIENDLRQQKLSNKLQVWINELKQKAKIQYLLQF